MDKSIKSVMSSYKQRLIQTNSRTRSFFVSKLNHLHSIDIVNMASLFGNEDVLLSNLLEDKSIDFKKVSLDYNKLMTIIMSNSISARKDIEHEIPNFLKKDIKTIDVLNSNGNLSASEKKSKIKEILVQSEQLINKEFSSFKKLLSNSKRIQRDYGKDDLYLGFPFVEGKFINEKVFRAPLVLHRVKVNSNVNNTKIEFMDEKILNPVFIISYFIENNLSYSKFDWDLKSSDYIGEAISLLKKYEIPISKPSGSLECINSLSKKEYIENTLDSFNGFSIKNYVVLGLFPISDRNIYNDIEKMEEIKKLSTSINDFIIGDDLFDELVNNKKIEPRTKEQDVVYISDLDFSQKSVVDKASKNNLVIEGPPGTGKSQVLVNIIANYLNEGKRVLVLSEKSAAINVVYNRLGALSKNALIVKNHSNDKTNFYNQLSNTVDNLKTSVIDSDLTSLDEINSSIEYVFTSLENRNSIQEKTYEGYKIDDFIKLHNPESIDSKSIETICELLQSEDLSKSQYIKIVEDMMAKNKLKYAKDLFGEISKDIYSFTKEYNTLKALLSFDFNNTYSNNIKRYIYKRIVDTGDFIEIDNILENEFSNIDIVKYDEIDDYVLKIINSDSYKKYCGYLEEKNKWFYSKYDCNRDIYNVLIKWERYSNKKQRKYEFKKAVDKKFKQGLIKKIFNSKNVRLSKKQNIMFKDIKKEIKNLNPRLMKNKPKDLLDSKSLLYEFIYSLSSSDVNYIQEKLIINSFVDCIFDTNVINEYKDFLNTIKLFNKELILNTKFNISSFEFSLYRFIFSNKINSVQMINDLFTIFKTRNTYLKLDTDLKFYRNYSNYYKKANESINKKCKLVRKQINNTILNSIKETTNDSFRNDYKELVRKTNLKRKYAITKIVEEHTKSLLKIYPVWLMNPDTVSALLPLKENLFDVLIVDEASQMFVEKAIPSIYRSKRIIIAGDSEQLKPSSMFSSRFVEDSDALDNKDLSNNELAAIEEESLLDLARSRFSNKMLTYHYRSEYKELINFSNHAFYKGKLIFSSINKNTTQKPIELINTYDGIWDNNSNKVEALRVVMVIKEILRNRKNNETIGVITFNQKQRMLIQDLLEAEKSVDIINELERFNNISSEDESLFVKNIENVQGDERDIIIFSIAYGKNKSGKIINSFGTLSQSGGENRLNVAITRAKKKIYIIKSVEASMFKVNNSNRGALLFKSYLQYVEYLNNDVETNDFLCKLSNTHKAVVNKLGFETIFEEEVYNILKLKLNTDRYEIHIQIPVGSFNLDLAIYDKKVMNYIIGIECEDMSNKNSSNIVEQDFYRQKYLESRDWKIYKIWSSNWYMNKDLVIQNIINSIS